MKSLIITTGFILAVLNLSAQNVGIGTTTPVKPLEVAGNGGIQITNGLNANSNNELFFSDNGQIRSLDSFHRIVFNRSNDQLEFHELGSILFKTGNPISEVMRITNNGNIGIGTALPITPNHLLSVAGGITVDYNNHNTGTVANILSFGSSGDVGIGSYRPGFSPINYHGLDFYTNYTKRVSIDAGGNVGIGTATPGAKLDVEGNLKIVDGSQGAGKVLTSDDSGNSFWKGVVGCSAGNSGYSTSNDSIFSTPHTIVFKNELYDKGGNNYDPATGIFTAPEDGIYSCSAVVLLERLSGNSTSEIYFRLLKNGSYLSSSQSHSEDVPGLIFSMDVKLVAGDNLRFDIYGGGGDHFYAFPSNGDTRMSIHLVK